MANTNVAFGLAPVRRAHDSGYGPAVREYFVPSSDGTALFIGDPVIIAGSADAGLTAATVTRATAAGGNRVTGVVVGFRPSASIEANGYRLASTDAYVLVTDDPMQLFEIQEDSVGGALAAADIGLNADLVAGTGNAYTKRSGFMLDTSTKATTATLQLRIVGLVDRADNEVGSNAKVLVRLNLTTETPAAGSTGI
jgi:hypothetical protein